MSTTGCCDTVGAPGIKPKLKTISIEARANDKYQVAVQAGERTLYVDQAVAVGGEGAGANPMEYLHASWQAVSPPRLESSPPSGTSI